MTRKIILITKPIEDYGILIYNFSDYSSLYQYLPDIYIFLQSKERYQKIKKMMQSANRIKYKKLRKL